MPSSENCFETPLLAMQWIYEQERNDFSVQKVQQYYAEKVASEEDWDKIPSLNATPVEMLKAHSLVKFRGMVQDMFDPEYFLGIFETKDTATDEKALNVGLMRDHISCDDGKMLVTDSSQNVYMERQPLYCVPVPGESPWVKEKHLEKAAVPKKMTLECLQSTLKRSREEENNDCEMTSVEGATNQLITENDDGLTKRRRDAATGTPGDKASPQFDLNFPLRGDNGTPCLIKIYNNNDSESIKLNDVMEFVGVLDVDPAFAETGFRSGSEDLLWPNVETEEEKLAHSPPSSLVPRLHCILHRKLLHTNPLLPPCPDEVTRRGLSTSEVEEVRSSTVQLFSHILFGDDMAAEFLLLNLIAKIYGRTGGLALGKFALNLSNCCSLQSDLSVAEELHTVIQALTTESCLLKMSLENLNKRLLSPSKDYTANRLKAGGLQLAKGTHIVLDENSLEAGKLEEKGVRNLAALEQAILFQKVEYDFQFHKSEMDTDINFVIISEGKSLLPSDCQIPVCKSPQMHAPTSLSLLRTLPQALLDKMRVYVTYVKSLDYNVSQSMQKVLQDDFVELRKSYEGSVTADSFHLLLTMSRLLSLSHGQQSLTQETWQKAKRLFSLVTQRQQETPIRNESHNSGAVES